MKRFIVKPIVREIPIGQLVITKEQAKNLPKARIKSLINEFIRALQISARTTWEGYLINFEDGASKIVEGYKFLVDKKKLVTTYTVVKLCNEYTIEEVKK